MTDSRPCICSLSGSQDPVSFPRSVERCASTSSSSRASTSIPMCSRIRRTRKLWENRPTLNGLPAIFLKDLHENGKEDIFVSYPSIKSVSRITAASSESRSPRCDRSLILALPMMTRRSSTMQTFPWIYTWGKCEQIAHRIVQYAPTSSVVKTPRNFAQVRSENKEIWSSGWKKDNSLLSILHGLSANDRHQCPLYANVRI